MKVLQINVVYGKGSTGKIVLDVHKELLSQGFNSQIAYGRGHSVKENGPIKFCTEPQAAIQKIWNWAGGYMYGGAFFQTNTLIKFIGNEKPDIVHLHCINGYCVNIYRLLKYLAKHNYRTVVTHHAEFFYTGNCGHALECGKFTQLPGCKSCPRAKSSTGSLILNRASSAWKKMRCAFEKFDTDKLIFTAVSPWLKDRSRLSPIVNNKECEVVENGIDTTIFNRKKILRKGMSVINHGREKMVLHVTASFSDEENTFKGGDQIVKLARLLPNITFVIVASYSNITGDLPENIILFGRTQNQQQLAALYQVADLTVIASKRETFSMVVAESLCCGTPVVGFKAGGPESIAILEYCEFVEQGDLSALKYSVEEMLRRKFDREKISERGIAKFDRRIMANKYIEVYKRLLG